MTTTPTGWRPAARPDDTRAARRAASVPVRLRALVLSALLLGACAPTPSAPAAPSPAARPTVAPASPASAAAPAAPTAPSAAAPAPAPMRVGLMLSASDAGYFIGLEQGYFAEQGIALEIVPIQAAVNMLAPLAAGQIDAGGTALTPGFLNAIAREVHIKVVADKGTTAPGHGFEGLVIRRDLWESGAVQGPADLRGRKVALPSAGSAAQAALERAMATVGLSSRDVDITPLPFPDMEAAFAGQSIDAAIIIEPFLTRVVDREAARLWARDDTYYPNHQLAVVLYSQLFAQGQTDVARRAMVAYLRGVRDYNDAFVKGDPAKRAVAVAALVKHTPVKDAALYDRMVMPGLDPDGKVNVESLAADQEFFMATGYQQQRVEMSVLVDPQFAAHAVQVLGPYR